MIVTARLIFVGTDIKSNRRWKHFAREGAALALYRARICAGQNRKRTGAYAPSTRVG
jgi:hypothetical protein